jgi:V/A-type H+/Na+-transporting ATPase subunit A
MRKIIGYVSRVIGPLVEAKGAKDVQMLELVELGDDHLVGEIVHLDKEKCAIQVYEETTGLRPGTDVYGSGMPLSVELGPGLIGTIYDGIQRPLEVIRDRSNQYTIQKGIHLPSLSRQKEWLFYPRVKEGEEVSAGSVIGIVNETALVEHKIMVPFHAAGIVKKVAIEGKYLLDDIIITLQSYDGQEINLTMHQRWPVRKGRPFKERMDFSAPLITGQRVIDTLFPVMKGGTVAVPGGFGTGKTIIQHQLAKWCDADIIVFIGCGERGNEMTDVLTNFPKLKDPQTGRSLMERTIFIANTSNMPVAAREASIYTGITMAEYYRDMGYHVAVMADSTSRWAEALRELSGRMEEMPADEGFPAYLPTRLAEFYERAGMVSTLDGKEGSVSIIASVSPPGGDFSEPVTQHTKRFVRCFWALDRELANARHYPSISWIESYSEYLDDVSGWWHDNVDFEWKSLRTEIMELLQKEGKLQQVVKLVGSDVLPDSQRLILEVCNMFKNAFLQQGAFDQIDAFTVAGKQAKMLRVILTFYRKGLQVIKKGALLLELKELSVYPEIMKMKFTIPNDKLKMLDELIMKVENQMAALAKKD